MDLDTQHVDYQATASARTMGRDLYEGDAAVKDKADTYLYQEKNESADDYNLRLKRAVLDPYVEKIVVARMAVLFRKEHARTLPTKLEAWSNDVDRKGTPVSTFFADAAREAQVDGVHWVLVDMPKAPTQVADDGTEVPVGYESEKHEREANHRPFFEHIPGANVIDWKPGKDRQLDWAVIAQASEDDRAEWGVKSKVREQRKVWTRNAWILYEKGEGGEFVEVGRGENPTGEVPLVPFPGVRHSDWSGYPVAKSVFPHVLSIYNKNSDMDWFERLSAHPIPWVICPEKPEKLDTGQGLWIKSIPNGGQVNIGFLETAGTAFQSIRTSIQELQAKIYAIALAQARKESAQVQSADSQREDRATFTSSLKTASLSYEAAELRCWQIAAKWVNESGEITVAYDRDFDDASIEAAMIGNLLELMDRSLLTGKTVLQTLVRGEVVDVEDVDAELKSAADEAAQRAASAATATLNRMKQSETDDNADDHNNGGDGE